MKRLGFFPFFRCLLDSGSCGGRERRGIRQCKIESSVVSRYDKGFVALLTFLGLFRTLFFLLRFRSQTRSACDWRSCSSLWRAAAACSAIRLLSAASCSAIDAVALRFASSLTSSSDSLLGSASLLSPRDELVLVFLSRRLVKKPVNLSYKLSPPVARVAVLVSESV